MGVTNQKVFVPPHKKVTINQTSLADLVAITGGDAPTEAEHNAIITKVNAIITALENAGILLPV
jgi:hypothetical protein